MASQQLQLGDHPGQNGAQQDHQSDAHEDEIAAYRSHVQWASSYARMCEEKIRTVDPTAEISNLIQRKVCISLEPAWLVRRVVRYREGSGRLHTGR